MGSVRKPGSQADESRTTRRGPGGEVGLGGPAQTYMLIPHQGGAEILPGTGVPWGPPCSVHPRLPWPIATGRREGGWPGLPPLPDPACPAPGAGRHMPTCCRSRPKITTAPPKALPPSGAARKTRGLLGSSSALQLDGLERGFYLYFFPGGKASPETCQAAAGRLGGGRWWGGGLGAEGWMLAAPGCRTRVATHGWGCQHVPRSPRVGFRRSSGADARELPGGPAGLAKAPARVRPRHALPPRFPGHGPSPGSGKAGGGAFRKHAAPNVR